MKSKIFEYVVENGPVLTTDVSKHFRIDSMYAGAYLSELISNKKVRYTYKKIGGSALYYIESQRSKLESRFKEHFNDKEQEVIDLIKSKKIVQEDMLDPVRRVVLKDLKDFAIQIVVNYKDTKKIFWKWHLVLKDEAEQIIKELFTGKKEVSNNDSRNSSNNGLSSDSKNNFNDSSNSSVTNSSDKPVEHNSDKQVNSLQSDNDDIKGNVQKNNLENSDSDNNESKSKKQNQNSDKEIDNDSNTTKNQQKSSSNVSNIEIERLTKENQAIKVQLSQLKNDIDLFKTSFKQILDSFKSEMTSSIQTQIEDAIQNQPSIGSVDGNPNDTPNAMQPDAKSSNSQNNGFIKYNDQDDDEFLVLLSKYFQNDSILIEKYKIERANSIIQCIVSIQTPLGDLKYYCEARNIKKINDGHLSNAFIQGQLNGLPVLFVSTGSLTKKAEEMKSNFKTMIVKQNIS